MGYTTTQTARTPNLGALRSAMMPKRKMSARGLSGPLTITISHGMAGFGAAAVTLSFEEGVQAAMDALDREFDLASQLYDRATDSTIKGFAETAMDFAAKGYDGLTKAIDKQDVTKLQQLQQGIEGVTKNVRDELVDATIERFVLAVIAPPLAFADANTIEALKEQVRQAKPPGFDNQGLPDIPWWGYVGGGLFGLAVLGYFFRAIK